MSQGGRGLTGDGLFVLKSGLRVRIVRGLGEDAERIEAFLGRLPRQDLQDLLASLHLRLEDLGKALDALAAEASGLTLMVEREAEEDIIAFACVRLMPSLKDTAWVGIVVDPGWRREGLGHRLLQQMSREAVARGVQRMVGVSAEEAGALRELLREAGFEADIRQGEDGARFLISSSPDHEPISDSGTVETPTRVELRPLFEPRSVAVIGASREPSNLGHRIVDSLVAGGFKGSVYPVNPHAEHIRSIRASASIRDLDNMVDLAIIVVAAERIPEIIDQCAEAGVKAVIVISAYFSEVGEQGRRREQRLAEQVRRHHIRMLGPNCTGLVNTNPEIRLNASFCHRMPAEGRAALCSQSGALGIAITSLAERLELGLSMMVNVGNRSDITVNDLLEYWEEDPRTCVILFYLESFGNPRRFARVARRVGRSRPIVVVMGGRARVGRRLEEQSGPGVRDVTNIAVEALMRQTGIISARDLEEMFDIGRMLTTQPLPGGSRVAVITNAGGAGILAADALEKAGLELVPLREETERELVEILPQEARTRNPVDMLAACTPESYERVILLLLGSEEIDALVVLYTPLGIADTDQVEQGILRGVSRAREMGGGAEKPVLVSIVGEARRRSIMGGPRNESIPVYAFPEIAGGVLGKALRYASWRSSGTGAFPDFEDQRLTELGTHCREILSRSGPGWISFDHVVDLLSYAGLPGPEGRVVRTLKEALAAAAELEYPLVLRLHCSTMEYRLEENGIRLNLRTTRDLREAFAGMKQEFRSKLHSKGDSVLILQGMIESATELRISGLDDHRFGPLISLGLGGIHLEAIEDRSFRVSPLTDRDALEMIRELRGHRLLKGYRGHPPADLKAVEQLLLRLSRMMEAVPEIAAVDLDPIMALPPGQGCLLLDARIRLQEV